MTIVIPVASGKGGVGKSVFSANLGVNLARFGKTVVLVDLDLGGSNLHTLLGVTNRNPGLGNYILKEVPSLESLIVETDMQRLFFIPGDALIPGTANLQYFRKKKIIDELPKLVADFVILDLGSGASHNTVDFFLTTNCGLIVTNPETTAILNAYSFLKSTLFRMLYRSFPARSREREIIADFSHNRIEGNKATFLTLIDLIAEESQSSAQKATDKIEGFLPRIVLNMGKDPKDIALGSKLRSIVRKNLEVELEYIGYLPNEPLVQQSVLNRKPISLQYPANPFSRSIMQIAQKLIEEPFPSPPELYLDDSDLLEIGEQFS